MAQLDKTVSGLTGSVDSVTQSVKTFEDSLEGVYTTLSKIQVGSGNLIAKSDLTNGYIDSDGTFKTTTTDFTTGKIDVSTKKEVTVTVPANVVIYASKYDSSGKFISREYGTAQNTQYSKTFTFASNVASVKFSMAGVYAKPYKVEYGSTATDWVPNQTDSTYELAQYKQTIDTQLTSLQRTTQTNANNIETNKTTIETTVNGIKTDISALQTYVNEDGTRTTAMQTYVKDENAKQTTALRTEVSNTYASKAQLTSDVNGLTAKFESIQVGGVNRFKKSDTVLNPRAISNAFVIMPTYLDTIEEDYTVTLWLKDIVNNPDNQVTIGLCNPTSANDNEQRNNNVPIINGKATVKFKKPAVNTRTAVIFYPNAGGYKPASTANAVPYKYKIEKGNISTDWSPAPEDVENYTNTKIAEYKQTVDQNYASLSAQVGTKVNTSTFDQTVNGINLNISTLQNDYNTTKSDFQTVKQTSDMYQRVLGKTEGDVTTNITNMVATSEVIQTTVSKAVEDSSDGNIIYDPSKLSKWQKTNDLADVRLILGSTANLLIITSTGNTTNVNYGFKIPITSNFTNNGETYAYRFVLDVDVIPDAGIIVQLMYNNYTFGSFQINPTKTGNNQVFTGTFVPYRAIDIDEYALNVKIVKNGTVSFHQMMIVKGSAIPTEFSDNTNLQLISTAKQTTATQTQVTQLADSYAIKVLNSSKDIITRINMDYNGITLQGRLIHLDGQTLIDNAVIKDAHILNVDAGKIQTGYLDANRIKAGSITAEKMVVDSAMINKLTVDDALVNKLTAKTAFITSVKAIDITGERINGGVISALNGNMKIDLNGSKLSFYNNATIEFNSPTNAIFRKLNDKTGFMELADDSYGGVYAGFGVTSNNAGINSQSEGYFAGIRIFRSDSTKDRIDLYGDTITFNHSFSGAGRLYWSNTDYKGKDWNLFEILRAFNSGMKNLGQSYFQDLGF